ncbi:hypothetical protein JCM3765_007630 [Sporobolomyces pararoseus]
MSTDDANVLAEIARLSSAIDQHKQYSSTTTAPPRGRGRGRGVVRGRGRGGRASYRGGSVLPHRNTTWVAPHLPQPPQSSQSRSGTTTPIHSLIQQTTTTTTTEQNSQPPPPSTTTSTTKREIVIGGVVFVTDSRGNKLVRKTDSSIPLPSTSNSTSSNDVVDTTSSTPRRTSHLGTTYIRTKSGNLVSLQFARDRKLRQDLLKSKLTNQGDNGLKSDQRVGGSAKRGRGRGGFGRVTKPAKPKSDKLCIFFQKTGQCSRAHTCRYIHDSTKISICPQFLRSNCSKTSSTCSLSHHPNSHRSPHCSHFPNCTKGINCPYAHVVVSKEAKVCRDFVEYGWCDLGDKCLKKHVRECWRFSETGECNKKGCKEPHVLRRVHSQESQDEDEDRDQDGSSSQEEDDDEMEGQEEEVKDVEQELEKEEKGIKRKRANQVGISGEAGRRLTSNKNKRLKRGGGGGVGGLQDQDDFVQLSIPSSDLDTEDEEDDDDQDGLSIDSDDLAEEEEVEENVQPVSTSTSTSTTTATATTSLNSNTQPTTNTSSSTTDLPLPEQQATRAKKRSRHQDQPPTTMFDQTDELDYGFSSAEEQDEDHHDPIIEEPFGGEVEEEELDGENVAGDETIYLEASEGFDLEPQEQEQDQVQGEEEEDEDSDEAEEDTNVANLLRR